MNCHTSYSSTTSCYSIAHSFVVMSPFSVLDSAWRLALDCYRSYVTLLVTCHPHRHRYSPPRLSVSFSLSLYVRLCQTDRLNIRFSLRSPPYLFTSSLVSAIRVLQSVGRRPCARRLPSTLSSSVPYGPSPNNGASTCA